jgi:hypothetical protein
MKIFNSKSRALLKEDQQYANEKLRIKKTIKDYVFALFRLVVLV